MNDFITRFFAEIAQLLAVISTKLNWLNDNKANKNLDNLPNNLTATEKTAIRNKIDAAASADLSNYIPLTQKGSNNGVAELDGAGKVPSSQLPSYVDDVLEFASLANFPATGESGKIYIAIDTNITYRWSGTGYVEISASIALGETSSTAYRGDRGKIAYDHAIAMGNANVGIPDWSTDLENQVNF